MGLIASVQATPGANGGTTGAIDTTGATLLVMHVASVVAISGVSDSKGNTWTALTSRNASSNDRYSRLFYCANPTVGTGHTFTVSATGSYPVIAAAAYTVVNALDAESGAGSSGAVATLQPGSITPAGDNELLVSGFCANTTSTPAVDSGFTMERSTATGAANNMQGGFADLVETTATAKNPTWTVAGNSNGPATDPCACSMAAFKTGGGGGTLSLTNVGGIAGAEAFGTPTVTLLPVIQLPARLKLRSSNRPTLKLRSERGALPDVPVTPPSGNPIISAPDWTLVGVLKLPASVTVGGVPRSTAWGYAPLAARRVGGAKRLFSTAWFGGSVYEVAVPGSLGSDLASAPIASVVNVWDDGTGSFYGGPGGLAQEPPGGSGGLQIRSLRWWDGDSHLDTGILWSYGEKYGGAEDWPSLGLTKISGSTATPYKVWKLAGLGSGYRRTGALPMPDGRIAMVGGGGFSGIGADFSFGPGLHAMTTADMASTASGGNVPYTTLMNFPITSDHINAPPYTLPTPALRDNDYRPAIYGTIDRNALSATQVYVPVANFSDFTSQGVGRNLKIRGVSRAIIAWDAVNYMYTVATSFGFTPVIGDDVEIPLDTEPATASVALWTPQGSVGYFTGNEHVGQPVWIEGTNKRGVCFPNALIKGRLHYQGGSVHMEGRKHHTYVYNPDSLTGASGIDRTNTIDMAPLGLPDPDTFSPFVGEVGREVNYADDPVDGRVYAILNYAWTDGSGEYFPAVYVYQVNS